MNQINENNANQNDIMTVDEAIAYLRIGRSNTYHLLRSGELKGFRIGRKWLIPKTEAEEYVKRNIGILICPTAIYTKQI